MLKNLGSSLDAFMENLQTDFHDMKWHNMKMTGYKSWKKINKWHKKIYGFLYPIQGWHKADVASCLRAPPRVGYGIALMANKERLLLQPWTDLFPCLEHRPVQASGAGPPCGQTCTCRLGLSPSVVRAKDFLGCWWYLNLIFQATEQRWCISSRLGYHFQCAPVHWWWLASWVRLAPLPVGAGGPHMTLCCSLHQTGGSNPYQYIFVFQDCCGICHLLMS